MPTPIKPLLKQLGLKGPEADIYLACLRLGEATVLAIAHEAKLPRTTAASILERLVHEGFITVHKHGGKHVYWIEDPHILVEREKARLATFEQLTGRLHAEYHKADRKPIFESYESHESITNLMCKLIAGAEKGSEFLTWESPAGRHYQAIMSDELFHTLSKQKTAKGIRTRSLIPAGHERSIRPEALAHNVSVRVLPSGVGMEISLWIVGDSVVLFSGTHAFATRTIHRHTAESYRSLFEFLWKTSEQIPIAEKSSYR